MLPGAEKATLIARDQHVVSRKHISPNALKVLYKLGDAGFHGFLVGGGVRDLLLGKTPKDFDIATNASPEELKKLFRNARIIGRRFKIVHLRFGREIIEVTTFRAPHDAQNQISDNVPRRKILELDSAHSTAGMILRDNVYGNIDEDALRRDFTINAMYYTLKNFLVLDFSTGMLDLEAKIIRIIGNPEERYKEDPVRMLRALRFCAKLGFTMEEHTSGPINKLAYLLESISPARLFDESLKLLTSGHAVNSFALLKQYEPGKYLFAPTLAAIESQQGSASKLVDLALQNTDTRLAEGKSVTPAFLFAALLWPVLQNRLSSHPSPDSNQHQHFQNVVNEVITQQIQYTAVPKRFTAVAKEIWELQARLERRNRRSIESAINHPRFRAAYDFLLLREDSGEDLNELGQWWTTFQFADPGVKTEMIEALPKSKNPRRRRRKGKPSDTNT